MPTAKEYIFNKSDDGKTANILIDGDISDWWGIGLREMANDISNSGANKIMVQISSLGGDVFQGQAIGSFMRGFPANIDTSILGICASIATVIALSGKSTSISKGSQFMIHNATAGLRGESKDLRKTAVLLDKIDIQLTDMYVETINKNGKLINNSIEETKEQVIKWQNETTWFTAEEAVEHGFIQKLTEGVEFLNKANAKDIMNSCSKYKNVPTAFLNRVKTIANMADEKTIVDNNPTEKGFFELAKAFFSKEEKPAEKIVAGLTKEESIAAAKALLAKEGIETKPTEKVEAIITPIVDDEKEDLKAELKKAKEEKEAAELKAQNLQEEKDGAPAGGAPLHVATKEKELTEEQEIENLLADQMGNLNAMASAIFPS